MTERPTVLLLGGTGRTGQCVLDELTKRGARVRAIVRSASRLPPELRSRPGLEVIEASLLDLSDEELERHVRGCDAVVSCLGHVMSVRGVFGAPRDLVMQAAARITKAVRAVAPSRPVRLVWMTSVSVNQPERRDHRRGGFERSFMATLRFLLPPAKDNQRAADYLSSAVGVDDPSVEWVVVRPDSLIEGEVGTYSVYEELVDSLFSPGRTTMRNIGHFMGDLLTDDVKWSSWRGKFPVIVDRDSATT
ncbi:MAG: SDR family oxidoreductase [Myxococcales bacterium]|nr:SDR family oxidoreductase [Myxococcales bacterium]